MPPAAHRVDHPPTCTVTNILFLRKRSTNQVEATTECLCSYVEREVIEKFIHGMSAVSLTANTSKRSKYRVRVYFDPDMKRNDCLWTNNITIVTL